MPMMPCSPRDLVVCQVNKARSIGSKHFSIVVTAYWSGDKSRVNNYSFKDVSNNWPGGVGFPTPTVSLIQRWKVGLQVWMWCARGRVGGTAREGHVTAMHPQQRALRRPRALGFVPAV